MLAKSLIVKSAICPGYPFSTVPRRPPDGFKSNRRSGVVLVVQLKTSRDHTLTGGGADGGAAWRGEMVARFPLPAGPIFIGGGDAELLERANRSYPTKWAYVTATIAGGLFTF